MEALKTGTYVNHITIKIVTQKLVLEISKSTLDLLLSYIQMDTNVEWMDEE